jgi:HEAT repeat protein
LRFQDAPGAFVVAPANPASPEGAVAATLDLEEVRAQRIRELEDLGMEDDPASLATILAELKNTDQEIRAAALEAAIQFGDRTTTLPFLRELMLVTEDSEERRALREAIEFIALPSILEVMEFGKKGVAPPTLSESPSDLGPEGEAPEAAP